MKHPKWCLLTLLLPLFTGCTYLTNRGNDFLDIFHCKFTFGPGALVSARITKGLAGGLGMLLNVQKYGLKGRGVGHWEEYRIEGGLTALGAPFYFKEVRRTFVSGNHYLKEDIETPQEKKTRIYPVSLSGWIPLKTGDLETDDPNANLANVNAFVRDRRPTEVGVTAHVLFVGVDMGVDLIEVADFLAGLVGIDIQGDDTHSHNPQTKQKKLEKKPIVEAKNLRGE